MLATYNLFGCCALMSRLTKSGCRSGFLGLPVVLEVPPFFCRLHRLGASTKRCTYVRYQYLHGEERATVSVFCRRYSFSVWTTRMCSTKTASRRLQELSSQALDWWYPQAVIKPPSRLLLNVWQMNSTSKTITILVTKPDHF